MATTRIRAPKGGVTIDGVFYRGGSFLPVQAPAPIVGGAPEPENVETPAPARRGPHNILNLSESPDNVAWLIDAHGIDASGHAVAILTGNEDCPDIVEIYARDNYKCRPTVYVLNPDGTTYRVVSRGESPKPAPIVGGDSVETSTDAETYAMESMPRIMGGSPESDPPADLSGADAPADLDEFQTAYVECALWSSTDNADDSGGKPLDRNYGPDDIHPDTLRAMVADCEDFVRSFGHLFEGREARAGHDFWLTRNRHGAGFWDGDWGEPAPAEGSARYADLGAYLTAMAHPYGFYDLYIGDDGRIHGA